MQRAIAWMFLPLLVFAGQAHAESTICDVAFSRAASEAQIWPSWHRFTVDGRAFEILQDGRGTRTNRDGSSQKFNLPLPSKFSVYDLVWSTVDGDVVAVYEIHDDEAGAGLVTRLQRESLLPKWQASIPSFGVGAPLCSGAFLYVTARGFIGKLDLKSGQYVWKHNLHLSESDFSAFNLFEQPVLQGENVLFTEAQWEEKPGPRYTLIVSAETGTILKREGDGPAISK